MKFEVRPATPLDVPFLPAIHVAAFTDPFSKTLFPRTPAYNDWIMNNVTSGLANESFCTLVAKDAETGVVVAYAKWQKPDPVGKPKGLGENTLPAWPAGADKEILDLWIGQMRAQKTIHVGDRRHFYLHVIAVHPDHQRQGIASSLLRWGTEQADEQDLETYLEATASGLPLYAYCGFVTMSEIPNLVGPNVTTCMLRQPVKV